MKPIIFEDTELSEISYMIDHLGAYENLPDLSEETSVWLWRFTICSGLIKNESSESIQKHIHEVLKNIKQEKNKLVQKIDEHFIGPFTESKLSLWINDLETILTKSKATQTCSWTMKD